MEKDHDSWRSQESLLDELDLHTGRNGPPRCTCKSRSKFGPYTILPVVISSLTFMALLALGIGLTSGTSNHGSPFWSETELLALQNKLPADTHRVQFTAGLRYNDKKELYRPISSDPFQYVGEPSKEMDDAWDHIIGGANVFVTPNEVHLIGDDLYLDPETKFYMAEPTVFHDLHCLYHAHYEHRPDAIEFPHIDHCLDALRQSIMCTGDMTLSPIKWDYKGGRIVPDFQVDHTCRDFDTLREWSVNRDSADPTRYRQNAERLHAEETERKERQGEKTRGNGPSGQF
ncbi:hypothetical protein ACEPPN_018035 [Leptodophora sp. 'Broadleaf-Isolate-01']